MLMPETTSYLDSNSGGKFVRNFAKLHVFI